MNKSEIAKLLTRRSEILRFLSDVEYLMALEGVINKSELEVRRQYGDESIRRIDSLLDKGVSS